MKKVLFVFAVFLCVFSLSAKTVDSGQKEKQTENKGIEESITVTCDIKKEKVFKAEKSVSYIDRSLLKLTAPSSFKNIFNLSAGVTFSSTGNSSVRPVVRGLYDERVLLLVNGIRQEEQFGGGNHTYSVAPEFVNSVSILKGSSSVAFGSDAIGGVVNLFLNGYGRERVPENSFSLYYQTATNGKKQHLFYSKEIGDTQFYFEGLNKDLGNVETPCGVLKNSYSKGYYFNSGLNYEKDSIKARLSYYAMQGDLGVPVNPLAVDMGFKNNEYKRLQGEIKYLPFGEHWTGLTFIGANQYKHRHMYIELPFDNLKNSVREIFLNKTSKNVRVFADFIFGNHFITAGVDSFNENAWSFTRKGEKSITSGDYAFVEGNGVIPPSERKGLGIFLKDDFQVSEKLKLTFGARYDRISANAKENSSYYFSGVSDTDKRSDFSAGLSFLPSENLSVYFNASTSFRSPSLLERFFYGIHQDTVNIGNPYLSPEKGKSIDTGLRLKGERVDFSIALFRTVIDDFIEFANTGDIDQETGLEIWEWRNLTKTVLKGGEAEFHYHFKDGLLYKANLSYVIGRDIKKGTYLYEIPPVILNNILQFKGMLKGVELNLMFNAHTEFRQDRTAEFEQPTPGFTIYNLYSNLKFKRYRFSLSITNLMDKAYHRHLSRIRYMPDGMGRSIQAKLEVVF